MITKTQKTSNIKKDNTIIMEAHDFQEKVLISNNDKILLNLSINPHYCINTTLQMKTFTAENNLPSESQKY